MSMSKKDKRIKICPNTHCPEHKGKGKYEDDDMFCKKCGMRLIYVCAICHKQIEDVPGHRLCLDCESSQKDGGRKISQVTKEVGRKVKQKAEKGVIVVKAKAPDALKTAKKFAQNKKARRVVTVVADAAADAVKNPKARKLVKSVIKVVK